MQLKEEGGGERRKKKVGPGTRTYVNTFSAYRARTQNEN
jgi:hypothetical protein